VICSKEDTDGRTSSDSKCGAGSTCRVNRDKIVSVVRLAGCKNLVGE